MGNSTCILRIHTKRTEKQRSRGLGTILLTTPSITRIIHRLDRVMVRMFQITLHHIRPHTTILHHRSTHRQSTTSKHLGRQQKPHKTATASTMRMLGTDNIHRGGAVLFCICLAVTSNTLVQATMADIQVRGFN